MDMVSVTYGQDRLDIGESLRVQLFAGSGSDAITDRIFSPTTIHFDGFFWLNSISSRFDKPTGTMVFELYDGTLDLRSLSVIIKWNNQRWGASINPGVTLIPEPGICLFLLSGWLLVIRRSHLARSAAHTFSAP